MENIKQGQTIYYQHEDEKLLGVFVGYANNKEFADVDTLDYKHIHIRKKLPVKYIETIPTQNELTDLLLKFEKTQDQNILQQWVQKCKVLADATEIMQDILNNNKNYINDLAERGEMIKF